MGRQKLWLIAVLVLAGCTKVTPKIDELDSSRIPQPYWANDKTTHSIAVLDPNAVIPVSGKCSTFTDTLEFRIAGYKDWGTADNFSDGTQSVDCQGAGTFSFNMPSLVTMGMTGFNTGSSFQFKLEAHSVTVGGTSNSSILTVSYTISKDVNLGHFRLTSGGGLSSSTSYKAQGSLIWRAGATANSTNYSVNHVSH